MIDPKNKKKGKLKQKAITFIFNKIKDNKARSAYRKKKRKSRRTYNPYD
jgi:hypothetical protein|tara:strand:+ start:145 stop:291 length:147 start_codon:yes stop_codon:yes gene_type:complete